MSSVTTEKGSLALSALNITNFDKSISDEILLDKETGLFYYNLKDESDENVIKNTVSVDLMNRVSNSINRIDTMFNKNGGADYKILTLSDSANTNFKPFIFSDTKIINLDELEIDFSELNGKDSIMIYIDSSMVVKFTNKIDIQQIPVIINATVSDGNNRIIIEKGNIDGFGVYDINEFKNNRLSITITNDYHKNSHIIVYGIYFVIL